MIDYAQEFCIFQNRTCLLPNLGKYVYTLEFTVSTNVQPWFSELLQYYHSFLHKIAFCNTMKQNPPRCPKINISEFRRTNQNNKR
jgi:hypothetical protein